MYNNAELNNTDMFQSFNFYTRTINRKSRNYDELVKRINREPDIVYPKGWFDYDIDRLIIGKHCVHHGIQELKHINNLNRKYPFKFDKKQRELVKKHLIDDHFNIENSTINYSYNDRIGVWKGLEININPIDYKYDQYLKELKRVKESNGTLGKGVFIYVIYTDNLEYFSVINFTNSNYVLRGKQLKRGSNDLKIYLEDVANIIEPCFSELLLFMLEAYVRGDFKTLYGYLTTSIGEDIIRLTENETVLSNEFRELGETIPLWLAVQDAMEWLMGCIHFDTILEEAGSKQQASFEEYSYLNFVKLVQNGTIFDYLAEGIRAEYEKYTSCLQKAC